MIDTLPLELLSSIFLICVRDCRTPPERLTWVSKRWRHIALNLPQLWVDVCYGGTEDIPRMLVFLERNRTTPFNVELRVTCTELEDDESASYLASVLEPHFHRIQSLHLIQYEGWRTVECADSHAESAFADGVNGLFRLINSAGRSNLLREFRISSSLPCNAVFPDFLEHARLQVLAAENVSLDGMEKALDASSQTLVSLRVSFIRTWNFPIENFITALATLEHLRELEVDLPAQLMLSTETKPLLLPSLSSLVIRGNTSVLLSRLVCHSLHVASVEVSLEDMLEIEPLVTFFGVHAKTITSLDLSRIGDEPAGREFPSAPPIPFPCLTSLSGAFDNHSSSSILAMIKGFCLTSVDLCLYRTISIDALLDFFDAASSALRTARVTYGHKHPSTGFSTDRTPLNGRIIFGCLESFESWCRLGDAVISATINAPKLKTLQLHGPLNSGDSGYTAWVGVTSKFGYAELPSLQSLILMEFSIALLRISTPALRNLSVYSVYLGVDWATSRVLHEPVRNAAREEVVRFVLKSKESLETLQLLEPLFPDAPPGAWSQVIESRTFPRLVSMSLCPGDYIAKVIHAPNLLHLEIRHPTEGTAGYWDLDYSPLATAETLVIASAVHTRSLCGALRNMKNIHHLQIRVDVELGPAWEEVEFLRCLTMPQAFDLETKVSEDWLFPKLRSMDLHFALWAEDSRLQNPVRLQDEASGEDTASDSTFDSELAFSESSEPAEYYSHSGDGSLSTDDVGDLGDSHTSQDIGGSGSRQATSPPVEVKEGDEIPSDNSHAPTVAPESITDTQNIYMDNQHDTIIQAARQPWETFETPFRGTTDVNANTRPNYGHFFHALQDIVSDRRDAQEVSRLHLLKISTGRRMRHGFTLPEELRSWFEANLDAFEAPK